MNGMVLGVCVIFLLGIVIGYRRGFLRIAFSFASALFTMVLVFHITPYAEEWLADHTPIQAILSEQWEEKVSEIFDGGESAATEEGTAAKESAAAKRSSTTSQANQLEESGLPGFLKETLLENNTAAVYEKLGVTAFSEYVSAYISRLLIRAMAFLLTFFLVLFLVRILMRMTRIVNRIPLLGTVNRLAGALLGAAMALLVVWLLFLALPLLQPEGAAQSGLDMIGQSRWLTFLYEKNPILHNLLSL